ncbi:MAG: rRNA maturation RNase YbeY [Spirochaetales bacterium]
MITFVNNTLEKETTKLLKKIYNRTLRMEGQRVHKIEACLEFVNNEAMQELNNRTRKIDRPTDVLSFPNLDDVFNKKINKKTYPMELDPKTNKILLGDVVINLDMAKEQADEYGHSLNREICYLFVHGLLHLLGYDHEDELDKNLMRGQEEAILTKFRLLRV